MGISSSINTVTLSVLLTLRMPMNRKAQVRILLAFLSLFSTTSATIDFQQCFIDVVTCADNSSECTLNISQTAAMSVLRTSQGLNVTSTNTATALSYASCTQYCGTSQQQFSWTVFASGYATWLLPCLALVSQLPFGAQRRMDNLMSVVLTLGSPTLAGYSQFMTLLNARWLNDRLFSGIGYPNAAVRRSVVQVLGGLQQVPLRIHPGESARFESLVVHPDNDNWWTTLAEELNFSHKWSIASTTSVTWVVLAYLLSVAITISNISHDIETCSQATSSGLFWLLPIVVGWLVLSPKCDYDCVQNAYHKANRQAFVADPDSPISAPTQVTSNFGLTISPSPDPLCNRGITSPDEARIPPIFNYARIYSWYRNVYLTTLYYRAAWRKSNDRVGVDGNFIPGNVQDDVPRASRLGTRDQMVAYCQPDERELDIFWPRGLFLNMAVASLMTLQLQWGTISAAIITVWFTPTVGLGCRSLAFLTYGALSTAVWVLLLLSATLGYYAHHLPEDPSPPCVEKVSQPAPYAPSSDGDLAIPLREIAKPDDLRGRVVLDTESGSTMAPSFTKRLRKNRIYGPVMLRAADWLRWMGKSLAVINAIGIIANSVFQYAGLYSNCYCDSSKLMYGAFAFIVINPTSSDFGVAKGAWIGGLALSLISCSLFIISIYLMRDSLPS